MKEDSQCSPCSQISEVCNYQAFRGCIDVPNFRQHATGRRICVPTFSPAKTPTCKVVSGLSTVGTPCSQDVRTEFARMRRRNCRNIPNLEPTAAWFNFAITRDTKKTKAVKTAQWMLPLQKLNRSTRTRRVCVYVCAPMQRGQGAQEQKRQQHPSQNHADVMYVACIFCHHKRPPLLAHLVFTPDINIFANRN